jgi:hypothetical protein
MTTQYEKDLAATTASEQREKNLVLFRKWLVEKHPEIKLSIAVEKLFGEYMDFEEESFTDKDFDFALGNLESMIYGREHVPTPEETKAALVAKIVELTSAKDGMTYKLAVSGGREVKWSVHLLPTFSIEQLVELLDEWLRKKTLEAKPHSEVQQIAASNRPNYGYPQLPKQIVRPGTVRAVPLDAAYLRGLDTYELKKNIRLYGLEQVNSRLAGEEQ